MQVNYPDQPFGAEVGDGKKVGRDIFVRQLGNL